MAARLTEVGTQARPHDKGINNYFSNQFGISGFPETLIIVNELY